MFFNDDKFNLDFQSAIVFARDAHGDQMYGRVPYITHLVQVAMILIRYGYHPDAGTTDEKLLAKSLLLAAILHDVLEDTDVTRADIRKVFGTEVEGLVFAVTNEDGKNRKERHLKTYPKIIRTKYAIILKLADRIANVENCKAQNAGLLKMYQKEWAEFVVAFKEQIGSSNAMWNHLDILLNY